MRKIGMIVLLLLFAGVGFASKVATFTGLLKPHSLKVDEKEFIITEGITVSIYSLEDYKLVKKFGTKGEGPQEFLGRALAYIFPDQLVVNSRNKISYFKRNGEYIKEVKVAYGFWYYPMGDKYVGYGTTDLRDEIFNAIFIYDSKFQKVKELQRYRFWFQEDKPMYPTQLRIPRFYIQDNKVITLNRKGAVDIYDSSGKKLLTLTHKFKKIKLTNVHKEKYDHYLRKEFQYKALYGSIKKWITYPDYLPVIRDVYAADKTVYVVTYHKEGDKSELLTFNLKGELLSKGMAAIAERNIVEIFPYAIKGGKLYQLIENESTDNWELHITDFK